MSFLNSKKGRDLAFQTLYDNYERMNDAEFRNWATSFVAKYATKIQGKQKQLFLAAIQNGSKSTSLLSINNLIMAMDGHKTINTKT
jgi:hypothetical protein